MLYKDLSLVLTVIQFDKTRDIRYFVGCGDDSHKGSDLLLDFFCRTLSDNRMATQPSRVYRLFAATEP